MRWNHGFIIIFDEGNLVTWNWETRETSDIPEKEGHGPFRIIGSNQDGWILKDESAGNNGRILPKGYRSRFLTPFTA